jgi:hypothetical protein
MKKAVRNKAHRLKISYLPAADDRRRGDCYGQLVTFFQ